MLSVPNGITQLLKAKCEELFGADFRSLAALRVGVSILILFDLAQRAGDLVAHYTDFGTVPRIAIIEQLASRWFVSLHLISGVWQVQALLFFIAGLFGLAMLVGYRTTLVTIGSWISASTDRAFNTESNSNEASHVTTVPDELHKTAILMLRS
jgi:hypothetical protein